MEGYIDVIAAHMFGFSNAVAALGTALTQDHGKLVKIIKTVIPEYIGDWPSAPRIMSCVSSVVFVI